MLDPALVLSSIPPGLRGPLIECFREVARNYSERRWEPSELNGGKFCEIVYTILHGALGGTYASVPTKPTNFVDACRALEAIPANSARIGDRSLRILLPRLLPFLYEIRNNRGVGHVGGDVNPNLQDATAVYQMCAWTMAELVRVFHQVSLGEAQIAVGSLMERKLPIIWEEDKIRRVLDPDLSKGDQCLLLLYSKTGWTEDRDLATWVEYQNLTQFRNRILTPFHEARVVEYEKLLRRVKLTPRGIDRVEVEILPKYM